ncbi:MAG: SBBP repeat-containing protein [Chlorobiota bacterium]
MNRLILITFMIAILSAYSKDRYSHTYSTYLGGSNFEQARDIAVDKDGNIYIVGGTSSSDFPVTKGAAITEYNDAGSPSVGNWGPMMAFVSKFAPDGSLIWSTYVGGPSYDRAYAVEVDNEGYVYIGGRAGEDFPTTTGAAQEIFDDDRDWKNNLYGKQNGFVTKLAPDGTEIVWSTYYGDDSWGFFRDIAIDDEGYVYGILNAVVGKPIGIDEDSFDDTHNGKKDMVVVKFDKDGSQVLWASFIGGSEDDTGGPSIKVGVDKSVYVCGGTQSADMPTTIGAVQETYGGEGDIYVARFSPDGSSLIYCSYFGGSETEATETHGLYVDHLGEAYVACGTSSIDATTTLNAYKPITDNRDCLLFKFSADGKTLMASTYFGGSEGDHPEGLYVDKEQNLYFGGETVSTDLPITTGATFTTFHGETEAYVAKLNPDFSEVEFCTYYGGSGRDAVRAFNLSDDGVICISGQSHSSDLPTTDGAYQENHIPPIDMANVYLALFQPEEKTNVNAFDESLTIYPNPATSNISIESENIIESITIADTEGRVVYDSINLRVSNLNLDVSSFSTGSYTVTIRSSNETSETKNLVIVK